MKLEDLQKSWDAFGKTDPLWSILTWPGKKGNQWEIGEFFESGREEIDALIKNLESLAPRARRTKALDFGCGVGRLTQALAPHFDDVAGVDIAPSMIALARSYNRYGDKCKYFLNATNDLTVFGNDVFDLIYTNITLQHIPPRFSRGYIKELLRVLAPGGLMVFQLLGKPLGVLRGLVFRMVPTGFLQVCRMVRQRTFRPMGMYGMKREDVVRFLEDNGARIVDIRQDQWGGPGWESFRYCVTKG